MATTLLETVKKALRITHSGLDEAEIVPLIEAAKKELEIAGVTQINEGDPLIIRAVTVYCKANFGYDNPDSEKFQNSFNSLKNTITQVGAYNGEVE